MAGPQGEQGIPGRDGATFLSGSATPAADLGKTGDMYLDLVNGLLYGPKTDAGWGTPLSLMGPAGEAGPQGPAGPRGSAGERGATGPRGPAGERGPAGPTGERGPQGSTIHSGDGNPAGSLGVAGDYYLDRQNGDLYGPKTASGWGGSPINLRGSANVAGTPWMAIDWDTDEAWLKQKFHTVPNPVLNAIGVSEIKSLNDNGGVMLLYLRAPQSPNLPNEYWQWQIPSKVNGYWDVDVRWSLNSATPNLVVITATETPSNNYVDLSEAQFRYVVVPAGRTVNLQARGIHLHQLGYAQAMELLGMDR